MSGGFFRGTSADQDTRFSNKQAKLLKSQKFAPELDHLVNTKKVKMDVIKPWIANRVTELLGFEDEVLINFIYGLLDGKEVNGKEVQISLTGFMEKNTGKFMKELWTLLLSAGKNESGVPQQFLDAKEEETRKKQAEVDRIANEIQKKKEKEEESRELERERSKKMDDEVEKKANNAMEPASKHMLPKGSSGRAEDEKETGTRNGARGRKGGSTSRISRSVSNSSSHSGHNSRSVSRSPEAQGRRSMSSDRVYRSPRRHSITPPRRRSSYSKHRSRSPFRRRSPSPIRRRLRSPFRRRSPSPSHDRSLSPVRRRRSPSPVRRRRSPSPIRRCRSPSLVRRRRSPSLVRRRSPSFVRRRSPSPIQRRSSPSMRRKSPSHVRQRYQRSPSTPHHISPPMRHRSFVISCKRSPTPHQSPLPHGSSSPSLVQHRSPSPGRSPKELKRSPMQSLGERVRSQQTLLPVPQRSSSSFRPQQRDQKDLHTRLPPLSPSPKRSPPVGIGRKRSASEDRRSPSPYESLARQRRERITHDGSLSPLQQRVRKPLKDSPESGKDHEETRYTREGGDYNSTSSHKRPLYPSNMDKQRDPPVKFHYKDEQALERLASHQTTDSRNYPDNMDSRKKDQDIKMYIFPGSTSFLLLLPQLWAYIN
ncbi:serine/arginine repetitive matrix protein 1-like isoform X2 [Populus alba x Populus x berolinensis]|nr:serine/arginine repetitive matrix protein 1-like isoform X2 [Populus alba x Populus x berolinensis]